MPQVELLVAGIPCEPFSKIRQNGTSEEEHDHYDLSLELMYYVKSKQPRTIVLEEVPAYLESGIGKATIRNLKRNGYFVTSKIVDGKEYGEITSRKRAVILATTDEIEFPEPKIVNEKTIQDILLPVDHKDCKWFNEESKPWIYKSWRDNEEKGRSFSHESRIIEYGIIKNVQAITKRYFAQQAGNPIVKHPFLKDTYRWLTLSEVKQIMGFDEKFNLGEGTTIAGEGLGQSVLVRMFKQIIEQIKPNKKGMEKFF